ncbi:uncharacterized protein PRCAT00003737001 [Priceomyces carsonii]|uniref:uncharacterized protein n=1 Tax=Priceomyces carsonii TaxID=28549 RepID=UPI002EDB2836|nr:unnamed protein product [Priceomyces carsonii]
MAAAGRIAFEPVSDAHLNSPVRSSYRMPKKSPLIHTPRRLQTMIKRANSCVLDLRSGTLTRSPLAPNSKAASLAATKLKLKLQFALYKVRQTDTNDFNGRKHHIVEANEIPVSAETSTGTKLENKSLSTPLISASSGTQLPTPPSIKYASSANINLKTKINSKESGKPTLSNIAFKKQANRNKNKVTKLRLFQIKKSSIFYNPHDNTTIRGGLGSSYRPNDTASFKKTSSAPPAVSTISSFDGRNTSSLVINKINLPRPELNTHSLKNTNLPSINKILKTPIKNCSTRSLISCSMDDTIDEDESTILETSNATVLRKSNDTSSDSNDDNSGATNSATTTTTTNNNNINNHNDTTILTSSPLANNFGTPNSFSVAKSLLRLGGYNY